MYANLRGPQSLAAAIVGLALGTCSMSAAADPAKVVRVGPGYDRPALNPFQSRSVSIAERGMVATSHPAAVLAGLEALRAGGNAADAAIAANAMIGLVEPMSCGIGGDLFAIYWDAKTQKLYGLNASGRSPYDLTFEEFEKRGLQEIPGDGPLCWSVPGCVSGWEALRARFGTKSYAELLAPSIELAERGFPVTDIIAVAWMYTANGLRRWPDSVRTYLPDGRPPREGELFKNADLAASYRQLAAGGADAFYRGPIAQQIVAFSQANGGFFSARDFAEHTSDWVEPVSTNYRGYDVWELPPNGQGIAALQMLNLLEGYDLKSLGPDGPEWWHLFLEAKKLTFADRATYYADPAFGALPVAELISKPYAERRRALIDRQHAALSYPPGDPKLERSDTIYLTVVDKDRNCCSLIQSNFAAFGSGMVPGKVGFVLQNRGELFALDREHLNRYEPHKRPFHTIIPAMVTKDGRPWFSFGVMGGDMQAQGHVQVLVNMIDFGMNPQAAGDAARICHSGSPTPTGQRGAANGGTVHVEPGILPATVDALKARGHHVLTGSRGTFGGYQGILIDWDHGTLHGASDPRKDGCALGY
ncbi:MAG: gamma-glutamyltransferase [Pirellulales bacterium]|nr:gamma-glutamyltransferase [Pirellulales bacterium]